MNCITNTYVRNDIKLHKSKSSHVVATGIKNGFSPLPTGGEVLLLFSIKVFDFNWGFGCKKIKNKKSLALLTSLVGRCLLNFLDPPHSVVNDSI
jgi:hypothetical protein